MKLTINPRFATANRKLTDEEYTSLEKLLKRDGCLDYIKVWNGFIIDGHNRVEICDRLGIKYDTLDMTFADEDEAEIWILEFGSGRRNLSDYCRLENTKKANALRFKKEGKEHQIRKPNSVLSIVDKTKSHNSQTKIAKKAKVSPRKVAEFDVINQHIDEDTKSKLRNNEKSIHEVYTEVKQKHKQKQLEQKKKEIADQTKASISNDNKPSIVEMDCIDFLKSFKDDSINLLFTDPPFSTDIEDISAFVKSWLPLALTKVKPNGRCYICTGAYPIEMQAYLITLLKQDKFVVDNPLIWTYRNTLGVTPKMKYNLNYQMIWHLYSDKSPTLDTSITNEMFSVQDINAPDGRLGDRYHTWQKPSELARRLITHSTKPGDLIVDPFSCTGTFIIEAAKLGRVGKGCDISKDNIAIAVERGCVC